MWQDTKVSEDHAAAFTLKMEAAVSQSRRLRATSVTKIYWIITQLHGTVPETPIVAILPALQDLFSQ
jgi:hypothetical protein